MADDGVEIRILLLELGIGANAVALGLETVAKRGLASIGELQTLHRHAQQVCEALAVLDERIRTLIEPVPPVETH